ncbi:hypothetical protein [Spirillospora sp. CA-294931]|uniref:hypothetical protein n=1 Tax=Spirillospora sp. CA-294931 TaxID=3240042 RepID=UPI003D926A83
MLPYAPKGKALAALGTALWRSSPFAVFRELPLCSADATDAVLPGVTLDGVFRAGDAKGGDGHVRPEYWRVMGDPTAG